jgi:hypothetical protein
MQPEPHGNGTGGAQPGKGGDTDDAKVESATDAEEGRAQSGKDGGAVD